MNLPIFRCHHVYRSLKKTDQAQKIRTEICRIFLIAKWRLIHYTSITYSKYVVAGVKLKILKANHNVLRLVVSLR